MKALYFHAARLPVCGSSLTFTQPGVRRSKSLQASTRLLDLRIRNFFQTNVSDAAKNSCSHVDSPFSSWDKIGLGAGGHRIEQRLAMQAKTRVPHASLYKVRE